MIRCAPRVPVRATLCALALWAALCGAGAAGPAQAAGEDFLPVNKAFAPSAQRVNERHVAVTWRIADGYYLYRHALGFALKNAAGARAGAAQIPKGNRHTDEFFGQVETYRHTLRVVVPVAGDKALPGGTRIQVTYQGCADAGICYPPQTRALSIAAPAASAPPGGSSAARASDANAQAAPAAAPSNHNLSRQGELARRLAGAGHLSTLGLFFLLGILLAFTPCILPMIPILSGLVVGSGVSSGRAFVLSLAYVLAMAAAYTVFGVIAGYFGANIQAALQMPAVLLPFAAVFVALALATFGLFDLQVPSAWRQRLGAIGTRRSGVAGATLMGFFSALIAGPCLAPPLVGALLYISRTGDMALGGAALFMLGLGMGVPLLVIGTAGARFMPRAGVWMTQVRIFFGVLLLAVAVWLVSRLLSPGAALAAWGALALGYGAYLSTRAPDHWLALAGKRAAVFVLFVYTGCAIVGLLAGDGRTLRPLAGLTHTAAANAPAASGATASLFTRVDDIGELRAALAAAARANRAAVVDFYADWCVDCVRMQHTVFTDPAVRAALRHVTALQVDVTDYNTRDRGVLRALDLFGPPALLFYRADGKEATSARLVGSADARGFLHRLRRVTGGGA